MKASLKKNIKRLKRFFRRGLGRADLTGRWLKDTLSIFVYHEVSDSPSCFYGQYGLNVSPKLFAQQMDFIASHFHMISPDELLSGQYETPAALITFDDGTPGYFRQAVPIMTKKRIPSLIFLNMAPIEGEIFWSGLITYLTQYDEQFCQILRNHFPHEKNVPEFLLCNSKIVNDYLASIDFRSLELKIRSFYGPFAGLKDLEAVEGNPFVFFGNHFYNHYNALRLSDDELRQQYLLNDQKISKYRNGRALFSFPFGQPKICFTPRHTKLLHSLGAKAVFSSSGRVNKGLNGFYDRIGIDSSIQAEDDLFGLMQWMKYKNYLKGNGKINCKKNECS